MSMGGAKAPTFKLLKTVSVSGNHKITINVSDLNCDALWVNLNNLTFSANDYIYIYANSNSSNTTRIAYTASAGSQSQIFTLATTRSVEINGSTIKRYIYPFGGSLSSRATVTLNELNDLIFELFGGATKYTGGSIDIWGWA